MSTRKILKNTAYTLMYKVLPYSLYRHAPQGIDLFYDLRKIGPSYYPKTYMDVGANIGQTAQKWASHFPGTIFHCFEPVQKTFQALRRNTQHLKHVHPHNFALGARESKETINLFGQSENNSLKVHEFDTYKAVGSEEITVKTLDHFCANHPVEHVDFLKVDTEGYDLEVLEGSRKMLSQNKITFIQVEASMNPFNTKHNALSAFCDFLEPLNYVLFGIYDQRLEWTGEKRLRFANPVFISANPKF